MVKLIRWSLLAGALLGFASASGASALYLTSPFTPMVCMGEEWAA